MPSTICAFHFGFGLGESVNGKEYKALIKRAGEVETADLHFSNGTVEFVTVSQRVMLVQEFEGNCSDAVSMDMDILQLIADDMLNKAEVQFDQLPEYRQLRITSRFEHRIETGTYPTREGQVIDHQSAYGNVQPDNGALYIDVDTLAQLARITKGTKGLVLNRGFPRAAFHTVGGAKLYGTVATMKT